MRFSLRPAPKPRRNSAENRGEGSGLAGFTRKFSALLLAGTCATFSLFAASAKKTALTLRANALLKNSAQESLSYLTESITLAASDADKRSILYYTGSLQEQMGLYSDAGNSYAEAASIDADDAKGMPKVSAAQLYLLAARSFLACGDYDSAGMYLNKAPLNTASDPEIIARRRLYKIWTELCGATSLEDTKPVISALKSYLSADSMNPVRSSLLFTLWFLTGEERYAESLRAEYPSSPEAGIVAGTAQVMSMPFWYFVPRAGSQIAMPQDGAESNAAAPQESTLPVSSALAVQPAAASATAAVQGGSGPAALATAHPAAAAAQGSGSPAKDSAGGPRQQLGLFRDEANASALITRLEKKGFSAYSYPEMRSSGTVYYIVVVDDDSAGSVGRRLRESGFECYPVGD